jgi:hypothetical protein
MQMNLKDVPFSTHGSYLALSLLESPDGLYLRNLHGDAVKRRVFKIDAGRPALTMI